MSEGVQIGPLKKSVVEHVRFSNGAETMIASSGQGIKEHSHGKSLYFAKNAILTLSGKPFGLENSEAMYALIPEGVSHGWQHAGREGEAVITSFEPGHKNYDLYALS